MNIVTTVRCIQPREKTVASRIVGKTKNTTVTRVNSGVRIDPVSIIRAVWSTTRSIPAVLALPFTMSVIAIEADKHEVPLVIREFIRPAFATLVKKRANIKRKKKKEITKRNLAKLFVKASPSVYLLNNFESSTIEIDIHDPRLKKIELFIFLCV
jgi:hypothetical protein